MGYTRSRRYANHPSGTKYARKKPKTGEPKRRVLPQAADWATSPKAQSARIFYGYYVKAREDTKYRRLKAAHQAREKEKSAKRPAAVKAVGRRASHSKPRRL
jgi:hypothetical protein